MQFFMTHNKDTEVKSLIMPGAETPLQKVNKEPTLQTQREVLLKILELRFGTIPEPVIYKVSRIQSRARLEFLIGYVQYVENLDDINWG